MFWYIPSLGIHSPRQIWNNWPQNYIRPTVTSFVVICKRKDFLPGKFRGISMRMSSWVRGHGTDWFKASTEFFLNRKLKEIIHMLICFLNKIHFHSMVYNLKETIGKASWTDKCDGVLSFFTVPFEELLKINK